MDVTPIIASTTLTSFCLFNSIMQTEQKYSAGESAR